MKKTFLILSSALLLMLFAGGVWAEEIEGSIRIAESMQMAVTPVFLLAGVGLILSVLGVRLGRIKDRMRVLQQALVNIEGEGKEVLEEIGRASCRERV